MLKMKKLYVHIFYIITNKIIILNNNIGLLPERKKCFLSKTELSYGLQDL